MDLLLPHTLEKPDNRTAKRRQKDGEKPYQGKENECVQRVFLRNFVYGFFIYIAEQ